MDWRREKERQKKTSVCLFLDEVWRISREMDVVWRTVERERAYGVGICLRLYIPGSVGGTYVGNSGRGGHLKCENLFGR